MNETRPEEAIRSLPSKHRFLILIIGSISIASILVLASMALYVSSGASQLDLSRPGYESIRKQAINDERFQGFSASGNLDDEALKEFDELYAAKLKEMQEVNAFNNDVLSPASLEIDQKSATQQ